MSKRAKISNAITYIILILISIVWLFPFVCLVLQSFRSYITEPGGLVNYLLPKTFSLDSYKFLFSEECQFFRCTTPIHVRISGYKILKKI